MTENLNHCCFELDYFIKNGEVALCYNDIYREYGLNVLDGGSSFIQIKCCPWCGNKLPKDVGDEFSRLIYDELNLDGPDDPRLPEEFKSREWWVKRGL